MANHRWMRTAISRCRTFNIVLVNHTHTNVSTHASHASVIRRIEGHKQADNEKKFHYDAKDYVTKEWVIEYFNLIVVTASILTPSTNDSTIAFNMR
jgi:hypothetical protein